MNISGEEKQGEIKFYATPIPDIRTMRIPSPLFSVSGSLSPQDAVLATENSHLYISFY